MLRQLIGTYTIRHNNKILKVKQNATTGECIPYNTSPCLSCQQIRATTTFESTQTNEKINIYQKVSCKSNYIIYLLKCLLYKIQFVRKLKTTFHIRWNNHRKNIKNPNAIEACQYFNNWNHTLHKYGTFILNEQLNNIKNTSTEALKQRLKHRENYWTKRLKALTCFGLNQELNQFHSMLFFFCSLLFLLSTSNIWCHRH